MSIKQKIVCLLILVPYAAFAKSGSVNYSWGADALATMHDFVVTMMLYVLYIVSIRFTTYFLEVFENIWDKIWRN